jgi:hypothetical protein
MVASVLNTTLPLRPELSLSDATEGGNTTLPLVEIIEFKWLLAAFGVHIHVERLQNDPVYARQTLADAAAREAPVLRAVAQRLLRRLGPSA